MIGAKYSIVRRRWVWLAALLMAVGCVCAIAPDAHAAREVKFPPPQSPPPPPVKSPPRTQASGEETALPPAPGPTQRKTQEREPPPPTTLTVMYKVQYGETLSYTDPVSGQKVSFEQWESYKNDGYQLVNKYVNERLADGNNYQYATKPLASDGFDPVDIPILFMAGDYEFRLSDREVENLRRFLLDGGTIIFNAARGRDEFNASVVREMRRVFPQKTFMKASLDHPIFNGRYRVQQVLTLINGVQLSQPPEVYTVDIGTRGAAILVPYGMGAAWSGDGYHPQGKHLVGESAIRLGVNLVSYVLGSTEYGRFLAQEFPVYNGSTGAGDVVRYATARYAGSWNVNPALQNSLMQGLNDNTDVDVDYTPNVVDLTDPEIGQYPLVQMTGHYDFELSDEEVSNVRQYLMRGGMLFASAAAGFKPFDIAFKRELKRVFPSGELIRLPPSHPMFALGWNPLTRVEYTPALLRDDPTLQYPEFFGLFIDDRLAVVYTPYDIYSGINHESNAYSKGVTSDDALRIAINVITYVMSH